MCPRRHFAVTSPQFSNGYQGLPSPYTAAHLPAHTTVDLSPGKSFSESFTLAVNVLNLANIRVLTITAFTFGGFHYNDPWQV
jgi:hypothetical protein